MSILRWRRRGNGCGFRPRPDRRIARGWPPVRAVAAKDGAADSRPDNEVTMDVINSCTDAPLARRGPKQMESSGVRTLARKSPQRTAARPRRCERAASRSGYPCWWPWNPAARRNTSRHWLRLMPKAPRSQKPNKTAGSVRFSRSAPNRTMNGFALRRFVAPNLAMLETA